MERQSRCGDRVKKFCGEQRNVVHLPWGITSTLLYSTTVPGKAFRTLPLIIPTSTFNGVRIALPSGELELVPRVYKHSLDQFSQRFDLRMPGEIKTCEWIRPSPTFPIRIYSKRLGQVERER